MLESSLLIIFENEDDRRSLLPADAPIVADFDALLSSFCDDALSISSLKENFRLIRLRLGVSRTVTLGIHLAYVWDTQVMMN